MPHDTKNAFGFCKRILLLTQHLSNAINKKILTTYYDE